MSADQKTISVGENAAKALAWVLQEEVDIAAERSHGLSTEDANGEVKDLSALVDLLSQIGGDPKEVTYLTGRIHQIEAEIQARSAPKLG